jgi:hypothetical protein
MTLRVPEDLPQLQRLAKKYGKAPSVVIQAPTSSDSGPEEFPIIAVEIEEEGVYIELRTSAPAADRTSRGAMTFGAVLERLEKLSKGVPRELFWVSSFRALSDQRYPELSGYRALQALPLTAIAAAEEPAGVAFLVRSEADLQADLQ